MQLAVPSSYDRRIWTTSPRVHLALLPGPLVQGIVNNHGIVLWQSDNWLGLKTLTLPPQTSCVCDCGEGYAHDFP